MSSYGAPPCGICGATSDYCHLTTATGIDIDCRDLQLKNSADLAANIELARSRNDHTGSDERSHDETCSYCDDGWLDEKNRIRCDNCQEPWMDGPEG
jgi:hypothetical protein